MRPEGAAADFPDDTKSSPGVVFPYLGGCMQIDGLLKQIKQKHPEQAAMVDAFAPLIREQLKLMEEWSARPLRPLAPYTPETLPLATEEALAVAERLTGALARGFPENAAMFHKTMQALASRPSPIKALCRALLRHDDEPLHRFVRRQLQGDETCLDALRMLLLQTCRALAAKATLRVRKTGRDATDRQERLCPCCHSPADMSLLHEKEGKRLLHCSLCGHTWRYSRTACPNCGADKADNLEVVFAEGCPEERAERCLSCHTYILSVDTRPLDIPADLAYYVTLGMGHLDVLMQEDSAQPLAG